MLFKYIHFADVNSNDTLRQSSRRLPLMFLSSTHAWNNYLFFY